MTLEIHQRRREVSLEDRYTLDEGQAFMSGVQALVRVLIDQHQMDARAGLKTASMVSGYQGSPLGGFDREVARLRGLATENEIHHRPAVNEELGATTVWGSQIAGTLPGPRYDGVLGVWYGKAPGVDRAADALRHGNFVGTDPKGGVLALCGDDPACKSSTIPGASESILASLQIPTFVPGSVQEALDLGRHAIACSRASGLISALKVVTNVADGTATVTVGQDRVRPVVPTVEWGGKPYVHRPSPHLLAPQSLEMEETLIEVRLELAREYIRLNDLNRVVHESPDATIGVVAAGATAHDVLRALTDLGLDGDEGPVRVLQMGALYPIDQDSLRRFAAGVDEIVVVEEKAPFLERLVKDALYGSAAAPPVWGKRDDAGATLVPGHGVLDSDAIARAIARRVLARHDLAHVRARLDQLEAIDGRVELPIAAQRTPFFCSGCPHNSSTVADDETIVGAGIGCHTMVMLTQSGHGKVTGITQMGGEGAQWIGVAPFVEVDHFVQNLGDGTFHHSGSLAIRAAVAAKLNVTYKLLFNGTVAMTGGQHVEGEMSVAEAVAGLSAEGVARIIVTTEEPERYRDAALPSNVEVRHRDGLLAAQRELAKVEGVTVLLHDQACAAELRRARKRGKAPEPPQRVFINPLVCEGCGDCGEKSGCLSVEPIDTEFGRRTAVNQTSCNKDFSCLEGDCPSFLTMIEADAPKSESGPLGPDVDLPEPAVAEAESTRVRMVGIGGTGVVTVSQVLGVAAMLDGRQAMGLDQTGLSQKAGPVVSDMRITSEPAADGVTVPAGTVDLLLGFDELGAATRKTLRSVAADRTVAVVSEGLVPTGRMIVDVDAPAPEQSRLRQAIDAVTAAERNVYLDARTIAERYLGDATSENIVVLGAALQAGLLPVSLGALREALRLNGVAVELNLAALDWGRAWVVAPDQVSRGLRGEAIGPPPLDQSARALVERAAGSASPELERTVSIRVPDLIGWGGKSVAERYAAFVERVRVAEERELGESGELTDAAARGLHKLLAYKDEYEVARLHLKHLDSLPPGSKLQFHLHPPLFRAMGMKKKLRLGRWFVPAFKTLSASRGLRGTPFDPFGYAAVRKVERELPGEYEAMIDATLTRLSPDTLETAVEIARLPELVRGYEDIKLDGVRRFRDQARVLDDRLRGEPSAVAPALAA